ncbi:endolytic transglycosylase MltG [Actinocrinis sp.]|uniref:endolytic transglycosylase MltG n=1 Tax=Actinocrinis sp. TaxID=1920516 RepID=UPI002CB2B152|nr:endolytic transglycosylase MltG [Actinocrinis sp.]HXR70715.1 endolytic transglycosylase MltG [Actinocrinis sp.]
MSDDGWYGDPQEPAPTPGYGQNRGRRAVYENEAQPEQPGQYPQQPAQSGGYPQDPYQPDQYSQGYSSQPQQSYYDELGPRATPPQGWNSGQQPGYSDQPSYQQPSYQQPYERPSYEPQQQSYETQQPYEPPQQQSYESQQSYPAQPQMPHAQEQQYPRRGQTPRPSQPSRPSADPYASGSYGNDTYGSASDSYGTGSYAADGYQSSSGQTPRGGPSSQAQPPQGPPSPQAQPSRGRPPQDQYSSGSYPAADPYSSGSYSRPTRDGYPSGEYPAADRDPRRRSGEYPTAAAGYASGTQTPGGYPPADRAVPGRGPANTPPQTQVQDAYARRRGAAPDPTGEYAQYEDDDEFPGTSRSPRRAPGYGGESGSRAEAPSARNRRRAAEPADAIPEDQPNDGRFSLIDGDDDDESGSGRGGKTKQKKGRNCLAVFIAFSVIAGGLGYGGYKGVQWYQSKYGAPPDYISTVGTGAKVDVTIPTGSVGRTIGGILFDAGIIKSQRAFTNACNNDPKCANIQAGTYLLPKGVSAASAITDLLDPKNQDSKSQLITYGGERASQIFAALETKTGWKDADVRAAIAGGQIDLPSWDTGQPGAKFPYAHIEGFMAAETYVLTDFKTPTALLKKMVDDQMSIFNQENLAAKASALGLTPYKLLIIASLARAEAGTNTTDLNKIAGVVFNRFNNPALFAHLGFDTATLYGMGNVGTVPNNKDTTNPYNTSVFGIKGLPPTPIDNPDQASIDAAINPNRANNYQYFCATPDGVMYAATNTQWQQLGAKYKGLCGSH